MAVPDYQSIMLPLLKMVADGKEYRIREIIELLSNEFNLSPEDRRELLPSGSQPLFDNRVNWANTYLKKAGLLHSENRGHVQITEQGRDVLKKKPSRIDNAFLKKFSSFNQFINRDQKSIKEDADQGTPEEKSDKTPEEELENAWKSLNKTLASDLLDKVKEISPAKFEQLVIDLLLSMGYGGSRQEAGNLVGRTGDGGIDGIINEDRLGLDKIYLQAKRWENTVPIKEVRDFAGALLAQKARKGVFITTSDFPKSAYEFAHDIDRNIVLINGIRLAELMIEFKMGVSVKETYQVKEIDSDYFEG
ncbi:restriction endonuclease [Marinilabilia rubra]|uniref:Restriction endonuclease n=1 Tax=Marinilabilia rubra TaxID=2162893 RepID=A0A2U2B5D1_9BACT|nr:restriction endonuclease [Marinilabilia rubra]PWD98244.1 restriction endonuclease [Marinilabilia rubra]